MLKGFTAIANAIRTAIGGLLQVVGITAGATRTMTVPDADFTAARTDAAQAFTGLQTFASGARIQGVGNYILFDTTGEDSSNGIRTVNDFNLRMLCGRGSGSYVEAAFDSVRFGVAGAEVGRGDENKNWTLGGGALATNASDGFLYVPTCAGTPTGTPTAKSGFAPIVVNTTNNKLYFYSGGAWRDAGP